MGIKLQKHTGRYTGNRRSIGGVPAPRPMAHVLSRDRRDNFTSTVPAPVVLCPGRLTVFVVLEIGAAPGVGGFRNFATVLGRSSVRRHGFVLP